jgi:hypothetical protein
MHLRVTVILNEVKNLSVRVGVLTEHVSLTEGLHSSKLLDYFCELCTITLLSFRTK